MVKPIMESIAFLQNPARDATPADIRLAQDLLDTLAAHRHECVGMAANMIGAPVRAIVFDNEGAPMVMFNPEITAQSGPFDTEEGCLSLEGARPAKRFKRITVRYQDRTFIWNEKSFTGWTAQIIQHEIDHTKGVII